MQADLMGSPLSVRITENTVQVGTLHGVERISHDAPAAAQGCVSTFPCLLGEERVYYQCGADEVRCVGD